MLPLQLKFGQGLVSRSVNGDNLTNLNYFRMKYNNYFVNFFSTRFVCVNLIYLFYYLLQINIFLLLFIIT